MRPLTECKYIGLLYYTREYNIMEPQRTTWKKKPFSVVESINTDTETNENYTDVDLPTVALDILNGSRMRKRKTASGRQTETNDEADEDYGNVSSDTMEYVWIAPIVSNAVPIGLNLSTGKSDSTPKSPRKQFNEVNKRAETNTKSRIDPDTPKRRPKLKRPKRPKVKNEKPLPQKQGFTSMGEDSADEDSADEEPIREGLEDNAEIFDGEAKMKELDKMWANLAKSKETGINKLRQFITTLKTTFMYITRLFFIPEMVSIKMVELFYQYDKKDEKFVHDVRIVEKHLKHYIAVFFGLWAAFNWWYLLFYTDHYIDFSHLMDYKVFNPIKWIVGPASSAAVLLNYYLLGKRQEEKFYENYVRPILDKKWLNMTLFFVVFSVLYPPLNKYFGKTVEDIEAKRPNLLYGIVMLFGCISYLYKVVFDFKQMKAVQGLFQSMLLTIIIFVIVMVLVIIATKLSTILIITYLSFYSFAPLLLFPFMNGSNPFSQIARMMADARESCSKANPTDNFFTSAKNFLKRNLFLIYIGGIYLGAIIKAMIEVKDIKSPGLKDLSNTMYSLVIVIPILIGLLFMQSGGIVKISDFVKAKDPEESDEPYLSTITKIIAFIALILEGIITLPFWVLAMIFSIGDRIHFIHSMFMFIPTKLMSLLKGGVIPEQYFNDPNENQSDILKSTTPESTSNSPVGLSDVGVGFGPSSTPTRTSVFD